MIKDNLKEVLHEMEEVANYSKLNHLTFTLLVEEHVY